MAVPIIPIIIGGSIIGGSIIGGSIIGRRGDGRASFTCELASLRSLARHTIGTASSHLGMGIQELEAGRGEVEVRLGEMLEGRSRSMTE